MTYYVEQREKSDCVIAAISMFTRLPYERVLAAADGYYTPDVGTHSVGTILVNLGYHQDNLVSDKNGDGRSFRSIHLTYGIHPQLLRNWMWGRECMFSVPSKNIEGGWHMLYYDGRHIHDPIPVTREGKLRFDLDSFNHLEPREAHVWQERL